MQEARVTAISAAALELAEEKKEQSKKITSDDIHEGWDSKVCLLT